RRSVSRRNTPFQSGIARTRERGARHLRRGQWGGKRWTNGGLLEGGLRAESPSSLRTPRAKIARRRVGGKSIPPTLTVQGGAVARRASGRPYIVSGRGEFVPFFFEVFII